MTQQYSHRLRALVLGLIALLMLIYSPTMARAERPWLECEFVESGVAGAVDDYLLVTGNDNALVRREGQLVLVGTSAANGPRDFEPISCGREVTVTDIDRILYREARLGPRQEHQFLLDEREGGLGPGASPEAVDPEIEVEVVVPRQADAYPRVQLLGGERNDTVLLRSEAGRLQACSEKPTRGYTPDPDLIVDAPPRMVDLKILGGGGRDMLDARAFDRDRKLVRSVLLAGDDGKDTLLGTSRQDQLQGGSGPDRLYGRAGGDTFYPGAGSDLAVGGVGADFISPGHESDERDTQPDTYVGGAGNDYISARLGGADTISCGPGWDQAVADLADRLPRRNCERLRGPAGS